MPEIVYKFLKFGLVGASGVIVDFGVTYFFKEIGKVNKYIANALGFFIAATSNYWLNRIWSFESTNPDISFEYLGFISVSLVGLGINTSVLWFLAEKRKLNFYLSKLFAIGVTTLWNFSINYAFVF